MGATLLCELGLFLLCTLVCSGHAQGAVLTIEPSWSSYFIGEFVTFKCNMNEGRDTDWYYAINKDGREYFGYSAQKDYRLEISSTYHSGEYQCSGTWKESHYTKNSNTVFISVLAYRPWATLTAGTTIIPVGGSVTLTCSVQSSDGWKYEWFRRTQTTYEGQIRGQQNRDIRVSQGGIYRCRGTRGNPVYYTYDSYDVIIEITTYRPWATLTAGTTIIPVGGSVTLTCSVQSSDGWKYEWFRRTQTTSEVQIRDQQNRDIRPGIITAAPESSSFLTPLIVGLVCGVLLILLLLLLLCRFKQSKDSFFVRTRSTNQSSVMNHMIKDEAQHSQDNSTVQGDACVYESIKDHDDTQNDDSLLYARVYYTKAKPKRHKGKPAPAAADETVYSEVKSQTALD
ncbi:uncharacterized protein LOC102206370 [Pundamilia nyererei]|uniref:Uncharacterized protein LOC102206370 n=1 Tax=Pundamilia nyererei TaxID=303518 RepID=A0A9Y6MC99_9CICH|nr:PREDICTED: uncharacterized protein LOC102206370 [Pundamilia nyererei]